MAKALFQLLAMNRGLVSRLALARIDLKRLALSADTYMNYIPRCMGSMMLRPGLEFVGEVNDSAVVAHIPHVFAQDETAIIELTDGKMRVRDSTEAIIARPAVTSTFASWSGAAWVASTDIVSNFDDAANVALWKDNDQSGGVSAFATGGYLSLHGNGNASAIRDRRVDVVEQIEHCLTIEIARGTVTLSVGTSEGGDELLTERVLREGSHSISIMPAAVGNFFVRFANGSTYAALVDSIDIQQVAGDVEFITPWTAVDLQYVRYDQSGDVLFVGCRDIEPMRIERQGHTSPRSWSLVRYSPEDGPFRTLNTGPNRLKGSALTGDITLTAEHPLFKSTNVGGLYRLTSAGQEVSVNILAEDTWSDPVRVTGIAGSRTINISITSVKWTGGTTVRLQRSVTQPGDWTDVAGLAWAGPVNGPWADGLDNQIIYYRLGCKTGEFIAGDDVTAQITFSAGSITGIVRVTGYTSTTVVSASVLKALGKANTYTKEWYEGAWSPRRGYPTAVALYDGRLYWAGKDNIWGSAPDLYDSFDDLDVDAGDARMIQKNLGSGPVDLIHWLLPVLNLMVGTPGAVKICKSSSLDEPLTQSKFSLKDITNAGTAEIAIAKVDTSGVYATRSSSKVTELSYDGQTYTYTANDLTALLPEIGEPGGFKRIGVQFNPDIRMHFVRADGTACILVFDKAEGVTCWVQASTDGWIEDVVVLPGTSAYPEEDRVYYVVRRVIANQTKRYLERWSLEAQGVGALDNRIADCGVTFSHPAPSLYVSGLLHLLGKEVVVWADGKCPLDDNGDPKRYTVVGATGTITLDEPATQGYVGLYYKSRWRSSKLAVASQANAPLTQKKKIEGIGCVLADVHAKGLKYGQSFDHLDPLPEVEKGEIVDPDHVWPDFDNPSFEFDGEWDTDARLCLESQAPLPCTILGIVLGVEGHDKV